MSPFSSLVTHSPPQLQESTLKRSTHSWKEIAARKQAHRDELLHMAAAVASSPPTERSLNQYTSASGAYNCLLVQFALARTDSLVVAFEIVQKITTKEFTASLVLEAYIQRAVIVHDALNCITEGMSSPSAHG